PVTTSCRRRLEAGGGIATPTAMMDPREAAARARPPPTAGAAAVGETPRRAAAPRPDRRGRPLAGHGLQRAGQRADLPLPRAPRGPPERRHLLRLHRRLVPVRRPSLLEPRARHVGARDPAVRGRRPRRSD